MNMSKIKTVRDRPGANDTVVTFDGTPALRRHCKLIGSEYFITNTQCFLVNGQWHRINNNKIIFDHAIQAWRLKNEAPYLHGVVNCTKTGELTYGEFTPDKEHNIVVLTGTSIDTTHTAIDSTIFENTSFIEGKSGIFYDTTKKYSGSVLTRINSYIQLSNGEKESYYSFPWEYSSAAMIPRFKTTWAHGFKRKALSIDLSKYLPFSFGVEFETNAGAIPERYLRPLGLIACRDGSIPGFEYVTIPLSGQIGLETLKQITEKLQYFCNISIQESMHVHLGGYPKEIPQIIGLYRLLVNIQDELYGMFPYFYRDTSKFKRRSYCTSLTPLPGSSTFPHNMPMLYNLLEAGEFNGLTDAGHPLDRSGEHKWNVNPRYKIVNLVPLIWGNRGTVEFRVHTPTFDFNKLVYWLLICSAILSYSKQYYKVFLARTTPKQTDITLATIIKEMLPSTLSQLVLDYIQVRQLHYSNRNDSVGEIEINDELTKRSVSINKFNPIIL